MLLCIRTTVEINDELLRQVKRIASDEQLTLKQVIERALRDMVGRRCFRARPYRLKWRAESGRIRPGVKI